MINPSSSKSSGPTNRIDSRIPWVFFSYENFHHGDITSAATHSFKARFHGHCVGITPMNEGQHKKTRTLLYIYKLRGWDKRTTPLPEADFKLPELRFFMGVFTPNKHGPNFDVAFSLPPGPRFFPARFHSQTQPAAERPTLSEPSQRPQSTEKNMVPKWKHLHWLTALDIYYIRLTTSSEEFCLKISF